MNAQKYRKSGDFLILAAIWLLGALCDRFWFALDRSIPSWDRADYLTGALNYWQALQHPQWFAGEWWTSLWLLSSKIPPGTYILTAVFHNFFGIGSDRATLVNLFFSAVLLASVYGLGKRLFNRKVGLWAAGLCLLFPGLYQVRLDFLLDFPLTAAVAFSFFCLTAWKFTQPAKIKHQNSSTLTPQNAINRVSTKETSVPLTPQDAINRVSTKETSVPLTPQDAINRVSTKEKSVTQWVWSAAFGLSLGLALMVKQTALLFLFTPILWVLGAAIRDRRWGRLAQLLSAGLLAIAVMYPWYRTNWLLVLTGSKRATVDAAIAEGDPPLHTLSAWTFYLQQFPHHVSWLLFIVPVIGFCFYFLHKFSVILSRSSNPDAMSDAMPDAIYRVSTRESYRWLGIFWLGSYFFCSLNINKDFRYVLPYLPIVAIILAVGLMQFPRQWGRWVRWGTCGAAIALMLANLWPVDELLPPKPAAHHAYRGAQFPHKQAIAKVIETQPYLRSTLGVLPSTPEINQHNFNYYGNLADFQVYGRQVGTRRSQVVADARSLDWFVTKTGNQGSVPTEAQAAIVQLVEGGGEFQLHDSWTLPDSSTLKLYRRQLPRVQVEAIANSQGSDRIHLDRAIVPPQSPPGVPVPASYEWSGNWQQLRDGVVLLAWQLQTEKDTSDSGTRTRWFHDRGIGMGELYSPVEPLQRARVIERTAMLPPPDVTPGNYTLKATYLNRKTGESYAIAVPPVTLKIDPAAPALPAPELDWVTQLRSLSTALPQGPEALGPVFDEIGRINQYDPIQDYLIQAELALEYRLQQEPKNLEFAYNLALAEVLQRDAKGAIAALETAIELDPENPFAHAYLAFVNLYDWHPRKAELALKPALELAPDLSEIQLLYGVASLMQGNVLGTWHRLQGFIPQRIQTIVVGMLWVLGLAIAGVLLFFGMQYRRLAKK